MFNKVEVKGDDLPGAIAKLLSDRPGEWFTFKPYDYGRPTKRESVHTSLIVSFSEDFITDISRKLYHIDKATYERLILVLKKYEPVSETEIA